MTWLHISVTLFVGSGLVKLAGSWLLRAIKRSFADAVTETVTPSLEALSDKFDQMAADNAAEHKRVWDRLSALEGRTDVERIAS